MQMIVTTTNVILNTVVELPQGAYEVHWQGDLAFNCPAWGAGVTNYLTSCRANDTAWVSAAGVRKSVGFDGYEAAMWGLSVGMSFWMLVALMSFMRRLWGKSAQMGDV